MNTQHPLNKKRLHRLASEGAWVIIGQILTVIGTLTLVRVLTAYLTPSQYGQLTLGLTIASLVNQIIMGAISNGVSRFYSIAAEKRDRKAYLNSSKKLTFFATLISIAIGIVLVSLLIVSDHSEWLGITITTLIFAVLNGYNTILNGIQNAARQRIIVAFHTVLNAWLKIICAMAIIFVIGISSTSVIIGYIISILLVTLSQLYFLHKLISQQLDQAIIKTKWTSRIWAFSWPFSVWGIFTWAQLSSDRWALEAFSSTQDVGLFAVLFQLGYTPIILVTNFATSFLGPIFYQRAGDATDTSRNRQVHKIAIQVMICSLLVTLAAFFFTLTFHQWIFKIFVAREYRSISYLLPWPILAGGFFAAGQMLGVKLASEMKSAAMIPVKITTAIIGVILNLLGAYYFGIEGVVAAGLIFSLIYFVWMLKMASQTAIKNTSVKDNL